MKRFKYTILIPAQRISGDIQAQSESQVWEVLHDKIQGINAANMSVSDVTITPVQLPKP
ncbi:hypothetical protein [Runella salmonicolor]|uniref:Uncharacterized protein n=1 Tax=Runella salmonicolor TaxID=2950278 RepID=A0ABT1FRZ4_9BACT|nr:hypothetical protein [Runella salmonicolor]MCP1384476.1 hypothetical protein [Runella salmonicolor]